MFRLRRVQVSLFRCLFVLHLTPLPDTITTPLLDSVGLVINHVHRTLICMACGVSVNHEAVAQHYKASSHKMTPGLHDTLKQVPHEIARESPLGLVYPPPTPEGTVDVVFGLAPPLRNAVCCSNCGRWYKGEDNLGMSESFRRHHCLVTPGTPLTGASLASPEPVTRHISETADVQQFACATGSPRFRVRLPAAAPQPSMSVFAQYQQQRAQKPVHPIKVSLPDNHRVIHQFLAKECWVEHLQKQAPAELLKLIYIPAKDPQFPNLARHVERYLLDLQKAKPSTHVRRLIGTRPNTE